MSPLQNLGVAGFGCGKLVKLAREYPDAAVPILRSTALAGGLAEEHFQECIL